MTFKSGDKVQLISNPKDIYEVKEKLFQDKQVLFVEIPNAHPLCKNTFLGWNVEKYGDKFKLAEGSNE